MHGKTTIKKMLEILVYLSAMLCLSKFITTDTLLMCRVHNSYFNVSRLLNTNLKSDHCKLHVQ
jgi:hypothetical protein